MRLLIAGGGTGGHVFPGIAVAEEVATRDKRNEVLFVGTSAGIEARVVPQAGFAFQAIPARGLKGKGLRVKLGGLATIPWSLLHSVRVLLRHKPDVVLGVGGYASGAMVLAARLLGIPTAIQEQNALPGFTNKVLGKIVQVVFVAFSQARDFFPANKVRIVGNPIRRQMLDNFLRSSVPHDRFTVLLFGGSLGARAINDRLIEALPSLKDLSGELKFIHQTGRADVERVRAAYEAGGFDADVRDFIDDMSHAYSHSDLVVCRAGATTLSELTVCKKAAILVPFPFATDDHQAKNAEALAQAGAALAIREHELDGGKLAQEIRRLRAQPETRKAMEKAAGRLGRPEAAKELADVCQQMMTERWGAQGRKRTA